MLAAAPFASWLPWSDRAGRLVWLKLGFFLALCAPAAWMAIEWFSDRLSPQPLADLIHESGDWAVRMLVVSLAVTPLRYVARYNRLVTVRRMAGLAALYYTLLHILLWCADEHWAWLTLLPELFLRLVLTIGLAATLIMAALGLTSNDWAIQKLGASLWNKLHTLIYASAALSLLHHFMEVKLDVTEPSLMTGLFTLLVAFRIVRRWTTPRLLPLVAVALLAGLVTIGVEALYYALSTNVRVSRVLWANLDFSYSIRPAWWVLGAGLALAALAEARARFGPPARGAPQRKPAVAAQAR